MIVVVGIPGLLFVSRGELKPKYESISVSPVNSKIAATLARRSNPRKDALKLVILQPGLNREIDQIAVAISPPDALKFQGPASNMPIGGSPVFKWSDDGQRLALSQNRWLLAAWDFEHDLFLQLQSNGEEELHVAHHFVSLLFEGRLIHYEPVDSLEKRYYDQMMSHGRVL